MEDRRRVIRDLQRAIRRKEIENGRLDVDLEEMAIKVAERKNVSDPTGKLKSFLNVETSLTRNFKHKYLIDFIVPFCFVRCNVMTHHRDLMWFS